MLSNDALKLLKWFANQKDSVSKSEAKENCKHYKDRSFDALVSKKYLKESLSLEGSEWVKYRIADRGVAYLEGAIEHGWTTLLERINLIIPILTFISGVIASEPLKALGKWILSFFT